MLGRSHNSRPVLASITCYEAVYLHSPIELPYGQRGRLLECASSADMLCTGCSMLIKIGIGADSPIVIGSSQTAVHATAYFSLGCCTMRINVSYSQVVCKL